MVPVLSVYAVTELFRFDNPSPLPATLSKSVPGW
jgi:hypothetical protein